MTNQQHHNLLDDPAQIIADYRLAYRSRQAAVIGRREVLTGKAQFGIFGDGKELAQLAIAHANHKGDWRSGYYRDQTWMMALESLTVEQFFAGIYGHADPDFEPHNAGRNMNNHFSSALLDENGQWLPQADRYNSAADMASVAAQMPRAVGLSYASVLYRKLEELQSFSDFSHQGDEVTWATIGNASTAEGLFWETVNAIGVLHAPAVITIYDDGYGISVPNQFQMVKENIYAILKGFQREPCPAEKCDKGYDLYQVKAWDYAELTATYQKAGEIARKHHIPALVHVTEATQPLGHSTSGSHERYKSEERLAWEKAYDCLVKFREWIVAEGVATEKQLEEWEQEDALAVEKARKSAWEAFQAPVLKQRGEAQKLLKQLAENSSQSKAIQKTADSLNEIPILQSNDIASALYRSLVITRDEPSAAREAVKSYAAALDKDNRETYDTHLYSSYEQSPLNVPAIPAKYSNESPMVMGFEVLNAAFDAAFEREPRLVAFGEDVGMLGDVNQGMRDLQDKYGLLRVTDTGIREATILGQAIGMALRGLRPICEMQYLDYLIYALQLMSDDLATLRWRTAGRQKAPVIIRTRGHRLVGIWHSGSQMAGILNLVRGMHVLVPRNMTQAAGFYNTLLQSDDPALVIEVLNGYRRKERKPDNLSEFTVPLGVPEILRPGKDVTVVTYGPLVTIAMEAAERLAEVGIDCEIIDVQSLLPFDINGVIVESLKKTSRVLFLDEDVPGGGTAYMMQQVLEVQQGYQWLDSPPRTLCATDHRPAYGSDGNYYSKPNEDSIFDAVYEIMREKAPAQFPKIN
ncbi:MAG: thiamine pyrophosphate-dependent enzyme [Anaerolineae bacterium]|jgi:pyruvate/2-oxoglutarate/acetoin dehydrogenase E1 component/TPP-dependent pyruvate/acetoin dehydrogenase alpha subunit|nr:thiamine pyrophosphate-dependent enzyme [Anaerolineae bacterium]